MPFHDKLGPFIPLFRILKKLVGAPSSNIPKWLYSKTVYKATNPFKPNDRKKQKEEKIHVPSLQKLLIEYRDLLNELVDVNNKIPELERKLRELEEKHQEDVERLMAMDEMLMRYDSWHLGAEYDPYTIYGDANNQPIHNFGQDDYTGLNDPSMGQNFSRLRPTVTPSRFYEDEINRINRTMGGRKGGKFASGGKFTRPVISNSTDRQSLINKIKNKINNLTGTSFKDGGKFKDKSIIKPYTKTKNQNHIRRYS